MASKVISLDQYLTLKTKKNLQIFIFILNDEFNYLDNEAMWLHSLTLPVWIVRMSIEEFNQMDMARYPKLIGTKAGKEVFEINGIPTLRWIKQILKKL